jgi:hypothetical protein
MSPACWGTKKGRFANETEIEEASELFAVMGSGAWFRSAEQRL